MVPGGLSVLSLKLFCKFNFKIKNRVEKKNPKDKNKVANITLENRRKIRARNINLGVAVEETEVEALRRRK